MKNIKQTLGFVGACALVSSAHAAPRASAPRGVSSFVRPYRPPAASAILAERIADLEDAEGHTRHDFEYSLPARDKLVVKVVFRKNGVLDRKASALFTVTRLPGATRNKGHFTISRLFPQPKNPAQDNSWYVSLDGRSGYGFLEGTPKNSLGSGSLQENFIVGNSLGQERTAFAYEESGKKFSVVVKVRAVPMRAGDKANDVVRYALK